MNVNRQAELNSSFAFNDALYSLDYHETRTNTSVGRYGEQYLCNLLTNNRYLVENVANLRHTGDLRVLDTQTGEIFHIEAKTAYQTAKGTFKFCLNKQNHTSLSYSDFVILLCIDKHQNHYTYVIPTSLLFSQSLTITSHPTNYSGKYSSFIQRGAICFDAARLVAELW